MPPPDPSAPAGQLGFTFDRSGYRVPAIIVSPWVDERIVINDEYRHTSMIATLRKVWDLGDAFTARDAAARPFDHLLSRETPRDPAIWPDVKPRPVPAYQMDDALMSKALSTLGHAMGGGMLDHAKQAGITVPPELTDPSSPPSAAQIIAFLRSITAQFFPRLGRTQIRAQAHQAGLPASSASARVVHAQPHARARRPAAAWPAAQLTSACTNAESCRRCHGRRCGFSSDSAAAKAAAVPTWLPRRRR